MHAALSAAKVTERRRASDAQTGDYVCGFKAEYGMEICKDKRK